MVFKCSLTESKRGQCSKTCLSASQTWFMFGSEIRTVISPNRDTIKASELYTFGNTG